MGVLLCIFLFKERYTIITLDINPSLELKVDKNENVVEDTAEVEVEVEVRPSTIQLSTF